MGPGGQYVLRHAIITQPAICRYGCSDGLRGHAVTQTTRSFTLKWFNLIPMGQTPIVCVSVSSDLGLSDLFFCFPPSVARRTFTGFHWVPAKLHSLRYQRKQLLDWFIKGSQKIKFYLAEIREAFWTHSGFHQNVQDLFFSQNGLFDNPEIQNEYAVSLSLSGWKSWQKRWWQCSSWIRTWLTFALGSLALKLSWPNPFTTVSAIEMRSRRDWLSNRSANQQFIKWIW